MEETQVLDLLAAVPVWVWVVGGILLVFVVFGDRGLWDYEVTFPHVQGIGRGEIDFQCYKKRGSTIEVELHLEPACAHKDIEIYLRGNLVFTVPKDENVKARVYLTQNIMVEEPSEGDEVVVKIDGERTLSGRLVRD